MYGGIERADASRSYRPPYLLRRLTTRPTSAADPIRELTGACDVSIPVRDVDRHIGADHLPADGFPHHLRSGGWAYLRRGGRLVARVRVTNMCWNDDLGSATSGMVIGVDPTSWEPVEVVGGAMLARGSDGYRYLDVASDGTVTEVIGGVPVSDQVELKAS